MMILGVAFAGRIWYNVAINTKGLLRFLALSTVWDKFRLRFGTQQTPPGYVERRPPALRRWGGFSVCVGRGKRPAMQNPLTGFLFPMGNKGGFCRGASEREGGPKTEAAK